MEEEIDLREYVRVLWRWWWLIGGLALVAAVAALVTSFLLPPSYEATALVVWTRPRYQLQFDSRIGAVDDKPAYSIYPQLATSDGLLQDLLASLEPAPPGIESIGDLRRALKAKAGADPSLVQLSVRSPDAQEAARIADAWAEAFVAAANALYGRSGDEQVAFFVGQAEQAQAALAAAEQALIEYQGRNEVQLLQAQLGAERRELQQRLQERYDLAEAVRKAQALRERVAGQPEGSRSRLADELTALLLQTRALGMGSSLLIEPATDVDGSSARLAGSVPIEVQLSAAALTPAGRITAELAASLDSLVATLEAQAEEVEARVAALGPEILALQERLQDARAEESRLSQERDVALETYGSLTRKVQEVRIAAQDRESEVRLASRAGVPERPAGQGKATNAAIAGLIGLTLGVVGAVAVEWWRGGVAGKAQ